MAKFKAHLEMREADGSPRRPIAREEIQVQH